jgi:hypothetical protein
MNIVSTVREISIESKENKHRISHYNDLPPEPALGNPALSGGERRRSAAKTSFPGVAMSKLG